MAVSAVSVFAALSTTATNNFKITYTAQGIKTNISIGYKKETLKDTSDTVTFTNTNKKIEFTGSETGDSASKSVSLEDMTVSKYEALVLQYTIPNNAGVQMSISLSLSTTPTNFIVYYAYATTSSDPTKTLTTTANQSAPSELSTTFSKQTLNNGATGYVYVVFVIKDVNLNASFDGATSWALSTDL